MASQSLRYSMRSIRIAVSSPIPTRDPLMQCLQPHLSRSMATETPLPTTTSSNLTTSLPSLSIPPVTSTSPLLPTRRPPPPPSTVLTTIYTFPHLEPLRFATYPSTHLHLPLRKDILHRAVIFEGDSTRQGTASTKWRGDVHGSSRKIRPQKGTGAARLGDKKSPMLKGGGVAHGPHPRDFSTRLPRKIYDLAWRTALSYRYRKGELVVVQKCRDADVEEYDFEEIMNVNRWGRGDGRSLIVTRDRLPWLVDAMTERPREGRVKEGVGKHGKVVQEDEVDVKDLLTLGRVIIEKRALDSLLREHESDIVKEVAKATYN